MSRVLVTGASGFIAKHIILQLLQAGHTVIGSLRSAKRQEEVRAAIAAHLDGQEWQNRLLFATLDLTADDGWDAAMQGVDVLMHTASPFPLLSPKNEDDLIKPAVDGTLRALNAAKTNGISRVILTSSSAAVVNRHLPPDRTVYDETDWSDLGYPGMSAYTKSKTMAERAAWTFVQSEAPDINLTVINPVMVLGPPLDSTFGTSVGVIQRILDRKDPAIPRYGLPIVDVRDVARMHLRALELPDETAGARFLATNGFLWFRDITKALKDRYPDRRIITRPAPDWAVRIMARFDPAAALIVSSLGVPTHISNLRARKVMGIEFIPAMEAVHAAADALIARRA